MRSAIRRTYAVHFALAVSVVAGATLGAIAYADVPPVPQVAPDHSIAIDSIDFVAVIPGDLGTRCAAMGTPSDDANRCDAALMQQAREIARGDRLEYHHMYFFPGISSLATVSVGVDRSGPVRTAEAIGDFRRRLGVQSHARALDASVGTHAPRAGVTFEHRMVRGVPTVRWITTSSCAGDSGSCTPTRVVKTVYSGQFANVMVIVSGAASDAYHQDRIVARMDATISMPVERGVVFGESRKARAVANLIEAVAKVLAGIVAAAAALYAIRSNPRKPPNPG